MKPRYFLVAKTLNHAITTASIDNGWTRSVRPWHFYDDKGNEVECIGAFEIGRKLRGLNNVKIYWGYLGKYSVETYDWEILKRMVDLGRLEYLE